MNEKPRALLCCFAVVPASALVSRRVTAAIDELLPRYDVVVLAEKAPNQPHVERYHGARLLRVPMKPGPIIARASVFERTVRRQLQSEEYALVQFFDPIAGYAAAERRAELGYQLIFELVSFPIVYPSALGDVSLESSRLGPAKLRRLEQYCLLNADLVSVDHPEAVRHLEELHVAADRIHVRQAASAPVIDVLSTTNRPTLEGAPAAPSFIPLLEVPPLPTFTPVASPASTLIDEADAEDVIELGALDDAADAAVDFLTVDGDTAPPDSALNPWLAQLVHGYCPPESGVFDRHPPPTTMPGRDT